ncbi:MAG: class IV adenylate cyclase [Phycisphaerae bacterium]|jgi:predicted adenylyl cyclase CyaB|nr:class IV adenylate cyclase [Phycisphaerae bacterium]
MPHEIEAKFKVADFRAVRKRLTALGAVYLGTDLQTDSYYDTPDRRLLGGDKGLRIRRTRRLRSPSPVGGKPPKADTRPLLTYKGPADGHKQAKIRREIQTRVDSHQALGDTLSALGLEPTLTVQKKRASYRLGSCRIELDELPVLGRFIEIETPTPKQIETVRRKLDIRGEPCTDHYITLLTRACSRAGGACLEVTFDNCTDCDSA